MSLGLKELFDVVFARGEQHAAMVEEHLGHPFHVHGLGVEPLPWPDPKPVPMPQIINLRTLSGLVSTLAANIDEWTLDKTLCICRPSTVTVVGDSASGDVRRREREDGLEVLDLYRPRLAEAKYQPEVMSQSPLGLMEFRLEIVRCFEPGTERERLLSDCAAFSFKSADVREEAADGLGFSTTDKREQLVGRRHTVENPVYLMRPYRSFPEAGEQVEVPFLCQIQGGEDEPTTATLTDVGGNAWQAAAAKQVGEHVEHLCLNTGLDVAIVW